MWRSAWEQIYQFQTWPLNFALSSISQQFQDTYVFIWFIRFLMSWRPLPVQMSFWAFGSSSHFIILYFNLKVEWSSKRVSILHHPLIKCTGKFIFWHFIRRLRRNRTFKNALLTFCSSVLWPLHASIVANTGARGQHTVNLDRKITSQLLYCPTPSFSLVPGANPPCFITFFHYLTFIVRNIAAHLQRTKRGANAPPTSLECLPTHSKHRSPPSLIEASLAGSTKSIWRRSLYSVVTNASFPPVSFLPSL